MAFSGFNAREYQAALLEQLTSTDAVADAARPLRCATSYRVPQPFRENDGGGGTAEHPADHPYMGFCRVEGSVLVDRPLNLSTQSCRDDGRVVAADRGGGAQKKDITGARSKQQQQEQQRRRALPPSMNSSSSSRANVVRGGQTSKNVPEAPRQGCQANSSSAGGAVVPAASTSKAQQAAASTAAELTPATVAPSESMLLTFIDQCVRSGVPEEAIAAHVHFMASSMRASLALHAALQHQRQASRVREFELGELTRMIERQHIAHQQELRLQEERLLRQRGRQRREEEEEEEKDTNGNGVGVLSGAVGSNDTQPRRAATLERKDDIATKYRVDEDAADWRDTDSAVDGQYPARERSAGSASRFAQTPTPARASHSRFIPRLRHARGCACCNNNNNNNNNAGGHEDEREQREEGERAGSRNATYHDGVLDIGGDDSAGRDDATRRRIFDDSARTPVSPPSPPPPSRGLQPSVSRRPKPSSSRSPTQTESYRRSRSAATDGSGIPTENEEDDDYYYSSLPLYMQPTHASRQKRRSRSGGGAAANPENSTTQAAEEAAGWWEKSDTDVRSPDKSAQASPERRRKLVVRPTRATQMRAAAVAAQMAERQDRKKAAETVEAQESPHLRSGGAERVPRHRAPAGGDGRSPPSVSSSAHRELPFLPRRDLGSHHGPSLSPPPPLQGPSRPPTRKAPAVAPSRSERRQQPREVSFSAESSVSSGAEIDGDSGGGDGIDDSRASAEARHFLERTRQSLQESHSILNASRASSRAPTPAPTSQQERNKPPLPPAYVALFAPPDTRPHIDPYASSEDEFGGGAGETRATKVLGADTSDAPPPLCTPENPHRSDRRQHTDPHGQSPYSPGTVKVSPTSSDDV